MTRARSWISAAILVAALPLGASAEILAMLNYESKPANPLRKEGIAIMDVDPGSPAFGKNCIVLLPAR